MKFSTFPVALSLTGVLVAGMAGTAIAGPAVAAGRAGAAASAKAPKTAKPVKPAKPVKTVKPAPKSTKAVVPFAVTGTLSGVNAVARTVTVTIKGSKTVRGTTVTVAVATTAKIHLNDAPSTLAALPVGAHVAVGGTVTGSVRTATRVNAEFAVVAPSPSPSLSPSPSPEVPQDPEVPEVTPSPEVPEETSAPEPTDVP
jgi:hypothetical protein